MKIVAIENVHSFYTFLLWYTFYYMVSDCSSQSMAASTPSLLSPPSSNQISLVQFDVSHHLRFRKKIDDFFFHLWHHQEELYIITHNLAKFIACAWIPLQFVDDEFWRANWVNPGYSMCLQQTLNKLHHYFVLDDKIKPFKNVHLKSTTL